MCRWHWACARLCAGDVMRTHIHACSVSRLRSNTCCRAAILVSQHTLPLHTRAPVPCTLLLRTHPLCRHLWRHHRCHHESLVGDTHAITGAAHESAEVSSRTTSWRGAARGSRTPGSTRMGDTQARDVHVLISVASFHRTVRHGKLFGRYAQMRVCVHGSKD